MAKPSTINRDMGGKKSCIADLRRTMHAATIALDAGKLHTALHILQSGMEDVTKNLPREKTTKPFRG